MSIKQCGTKVSATLKSDLEKLQLQEQEVLDKAMALLNEQTVKDMEKAFENIAKRTNGNPKEFRKQAQALLNSMKQERMLAKLDQIEAKQIVKKLSNMTNQEAFIKKNGKLDYEEMILTPLVGSNKNVEGANFNVGNVIEVNHNRYQNLLHTMFDKHETKILSKGANGKSAIEVMTEIEEILEVGTKNAANKYDPQMVQIAQKVRDFLDFMHAEKVKAGYKLGYVEDYVVRSYDPEKIAGNRVRAKQLLKDSLDDLENQFPNKTDAQIDEVIDDILDNIIEGDLTKGFMDMDVLERSGRSSLEARVTKSRKLQFKKGASATWNAEFGKATLMENLVNIAKTSSKQNALREVLGPNPKATHEKFIKDLLMKANDSGDVEAVKMIKKMQTGVSQESGFALKEIAESLKLTPKLEDIWANLDGTASRAGNKSWAWLFGNARSYLYMTTLGKSMITASSDIGLMANNLSAITGKNLMSTWKDSVTNTLSAYPDLLRAWTTGKLSTAQKEVFETLNIHMEVGMGAMFKDIGVESAASKGMASMMDFFTRINPIGMQTAVHKSVLLSTFGDYLGRGLKEGKIDGALEMSLKRSNITPDYYGALSYMVRDFKGKVKAFGSADVKNIPDNVLEKLGKTLADKDPSFNGVTPAKMRKHIARQVDTLFGDISTNGIPTPTLKQQAILNQGTKAGTVSAEMLKTFAMLKSFALKMNDTMSRIYHANGGNMEGVKGLTAYMVTMTGMGYAIMSMKDATANKSPRDPMNPEVFAEAFAQGGGAGVYADLLMQFMSNKHNNFASSMQGPLVGTVDKISSLATRASRGELKRKDLNTLIGMTPYNNHLVARPILDAMFLEDFMNANDPKRARRIRKRMRELGQSRLYK